MLYGYSFDNVVHSDSEERDKQAMIEYILTRSPQIPGFEPQDPEQLQSMAFQEIQGLFENAQIEIESLRRPDLADLDPLDYGHIPG